MAQMALTLLIGAVVIALLPSSPFTMFVEALEKIPYLGILNWFIPIKQIIAVSEAWLAAISLFYMYSILLRYIKAIGD
jgi:hypothetical protein